MLTKERKKQLDTDLWIIAGVSLLVLVIYTVFGREIDNIAADTEIPIVLRVLFMGGIFQFGIAGLGITIVAIVRKERFSDHGLTRKHLLPAIALSALCCVPDLMYNLFAGNVHTWLPFSDVQTTAEALESGFPENALAMLLTALFWGFFEGFNYVVISDKIGECYPSQNRLWDWGAFVCAVMCILIHGAVGVTPDAVEEMLCTLFLIYGMLIVRKATGNAWGCILIFAFYWNAL